MKKLLFWALLLTTGFALYSCDERFDNPVTGGETVQATTFTYEASIKFADVNWNYWDDDAQEYKYYEAPKTVYVYNEKFQLLGELKAKEDIVAGDFNKFSGKLTGEIGEKLFISSLKDFEAAGNLDGTWETVIKYGVLMAAEAPIIIKNTVGNTIATKNVTLENKTTVAGLYLYNWARSNDKVLKVTAKGLLSPYATEEIEKEFTINLKEDVSFNDLFVIPVVAKEADEDDEDYEGIELKFNIDSENGYKSIGIWEHFMPDFDDFKGWYGISMQVTDLDLTKYAAYLKGDNENIPATNIYIYNYDADLSITQSENEALPIYLYIYGRKNVTFNGLNIRYLLLRGNYSENPENSYDYRPTITLVGDNVIGSEDNYEWTAMRVYTAATFKGNGSLTVDANGWGIGIYNYYTFIDSEGENKHLPSGITLEDNVTIKFNKRVEVNSYIEGEETIPCYIAINGGSFRANKGIQLNSGKVTFGTKATSLIVASNAEGANGVCINSGGQEAELDDLVEDKTKFNDGIELTDYNFNVRTITPKK